MRKNEGFTPLPTRVRRKIINLTPFCSMALQSSQPLPGILDLSNRGQHQDSRSNLKK